MTVAGAEGKHFWRPGEDLRRIALSLDKTTEAAKVQAETGARLTLAACQPMPPCQSAGRPPPNRPGSHETWALRGEESPGSSETRCRITSGGGDPRDSATESKPPARIHVCAGQGERVR